jgi:hypothetical protein
MYATIGKWVVRTSIYYVRRRYKSQIRVGVGVAAVAVGIAAYLASRDVPEG